MTKKADEQQPEYRVDNPEETWGKFLTVAKKMATTPKEARKHSGDKEGKPKTAG